MPSFKTMRDFSKVKKSAITLGIEVEMESLDNAINGPIVDGWSRKTDGSLRGPVAAEYVSNGATYEEAEGLLTNLFASLNKVGYKYNKSSPRTSIHIHHSVNERPFREVFMSVLTLLLYEDVLVPFCGTETRKGNAFCATAQDRLGVATRITETLLTNTPLSMEDKYRFTNLTPIYTRGSLEMRGLEFTDDIPRILAWINGVKRVLDKSFETSPTPTDLINNIVAKGAKEYLTSLLWSSGLFPKIRLASPDWDSVYEAAANLDPIFNFTDDWDYFFEKQEQMVGNDKKNKQVPMWMLEDDEVFQPINRVFQANDLVRAAEVMRANQVR